MSESSGDADSTTGIFCLNGGVGALSEILPFVVQERDIDLLLLEEMHVDSEFVDWWGRRIGLASASFDGAWHSVCSDGGETDLLLRVKAGQERVGVLIEDKIAATEQPNQGSRYCQRGKNNVADGWFDRFVTCICAPRKYLNLLHSDSSYQYRVAYEDVADWFADQAGARAAWRRRMIELAISQGRKGYVKIVNDAVTAFHMAYWRRLCSTQPNLRMARPTDKGSGGTWIMVSVDGWPSTMHLNHKLKRGSVELSFERHTREELFAIEHDWPADITPITTGRYGSLAIMVPVIDVTESFEGQVTAVDEAFAAMQRLVPFASLLDKLSEKSNSQSELGDGDSQLA